MNKTKRFFISAFVPLIFAFVSIGLYHQTTLVGEKNSFTEKDTIEFGCHPCTQFDINYQIQKVYGIPFEPVFLLFLFFLFLIISLILPVWICSDKKHIERIELKLTK